MGHLLEAIKGSTLSLVAALKSHAKLNAMRDEDLFAGLPEGTLCVCVCTLHFPLFGTMCEFGGVITPNISEVGLMETLL